MATICEDLKIKPWIFGQHRCHSIYISFGGDKSKLIDELLGKKTGCNRGMGGSASISSKEINMFGHDGLMGSNGPIGVGLVLQPITRQLYFLVMQQQKKIMF